ncbi:ATP-binding protein [Candidatus Pacearchaeota archaeon]|nr:ATP-binding protein [Candidatus Pacearchaeota archaeon]
MARSKSKVILVRDIGDSGVDDVSRMVTRDPYAAVIELVANSYDADANRVKMKYNSGKGLFSILDDGSGMTPQDLVSFYWIGDSPKRKQPVSPEGRRRIGKFGAATIVIPNMCASYTLITRKDGLETTVRETFDGPLRRGQEIEYEKPTEVSSELHGTEIHMEGLRFGEGNDFILNRLFTKLHWEFQLPPDFQISLNSQFVGSKEIPYAERIEVSEDFLSGIVHGTMYLTKRSVENQGIHVYVNGRQVGDPKSFVNYSKLSRACDGKILGVLHSNPLEKAILFDREKFDESDPDVVKFRGFVEGLNQKISGIARKRSERTKKNAIEGNIPSALRRITEYFYRSRVAEFRSATEIVISQNFNDGELGAVEVQTSRIKLNPKHPSLVVPSGELKLPFQSRSHYESEMIAAVVDVLAANRAKVKGGVDFQKYSSERERIWRQLKKIS